jgi:DNA repair protein RecO (recombination protein O)
MLEKTPGIILHQVKYTDSGNIAQVFTRRFGRQSFMVRGIRNRRPGKQNVHLQPLSIIDIELYYRESRSIHTLKEFSVSFLPADIYNNIIKSSIALFLGEVLTTVLREESPQEELFDYIRDSIIYLDGLNEGYSNFHIAFLCGLCSFIGIEPGRRTGKEEKCFFDMQNGAFLPLPPPHGNYAGAEISGILSEFFSSSWREMQKIALSGSLRNEALNEILRYYSIHLPTLKKINSLEVLKEVFSSTK